METKNTGWKTYKIDNIPQGLHTLVWRYTKLNVLPTTEFMEAEIESITVRGRHSNRLTACYPCNLGHSKPGSGKCELCPTNSYFFVNEANAEYYCAPCPKGYYSAQGSVGETSCKQRRPCDEGDLHITHSKCKHGLRSLKYTWVDLDNDKEPDCDPAHPASTVKELPEEAKNVPCK